MRVKKQSSFIGQWNRLVEGAVNMGTGRTLLMASMFALLLGFLFYMLVLGPLEEVKVAARLELQTLEKQNTDARHIRETKQAFLTDFRQALDFYEAAREQLPEDQEVSTALGTIRDMAAQDGVKVISFEANKIEAKTKVAGKLYAQHVPATISGSHAAVTKFLVNLSRYDRIVHIKKFDFKSIKRQETLDMQLATFSLPSPDELPPVPNELKKSETAKLD
jgi:Tfp pilus assembly protein PilO